MESSHGKKGVEGKCRKDKGHDLLYRPGPLAELRQIPMHFVHHTGVASTLYCKGCKLWVHKKYNWLQCLTSNPDYTGVAQA